jgi:glycosyltransferase involved in cell wall biosynthesis
LVFQAFVVKILLSNMPQVTIGMSCLNEERFVGDAVRSILNQSWRDWELILVDDGSSDDTASILRKFTDPRIHVIVDGKRLGLAARLNEISCLAKGKYIARMDADDVAHPLRVQRQVEFLESHPEIDAVGTGMAIVDRDGSIRRQRILPENAFRGAGSFDIAHPTLCCRTEWTLSHPYNESNRKCEDYELWSSIKSASVRNLPSVLYFYREYESFSFTKYLLMKAKVAQIDMTSSPRRWKRVPRTIASCAVYSGAALVGRTDQLIARRSREIPEMERAPLQAAFDQVRSA